MPAPVALDIDAHAERLAIALESGVEPIEAMHLAEQAGYGTPFALACTALARGDDKPARELCRREARKFGAAWAEELREEIKRVVAESPHSVGDLGAFTRLGG
jgi:hypothetical protein